MRRSVEHRGACTERRGVKRRAPKRRASRCVHRRAPNPKCRGTKHQAQKRCTKRRSAAPSAEALTPKAQERDCRSAGTKHGTLAQTPKRQLTRRAETLSAGGNLLVMLRLSSNAKTKHRSTWSWRQDSEPCVDEQDSEPCVDEQVLMEVGKMIGSYPFKFQGARILSGVEEGAYGWITINYLLSSFIKVDDTDISWMLGYTLNLTSLIPTETPAR
ncbi:UNVERIFIED_CONTAM: hypothetical protein FKN15_075862 [Acipenser sinensis]